MRTLPKWSATIVATAIGLCGVAFAQETATEKEQASAWMDALKRKDRAAAAAIVAQHPAWLNLETQLAGAAKSGDLWAFEFLLANQADPRKSVPSHAGLTARDLAFERCDRGIVLTLLRASPETAPVDWRRAVDAPASAKATIREIGAAACRLRCTTVNGANSGSNCFPDGKMDTLRQQADYFLKTWNRDAWKQSSYDNSMLAILSVLKGYAANPTAMNALAVEEAVADFQVKYEDCASGPTGAGRMIAIEVQTVADDPQSRSPGWQVLYKRKLFETDNTVEFEPFPTLSSPARATLPPGRYVVVARKGNRTTPPITQRTAPVAAPVTWTIPINLAVEK